MISNSIGSESNEKQSNAEAVFESFCTHDENGHRVSFMKFEQWFNCLERYYL